MNMPYAWAVPLESLREQLDPPGLCNQNSISLRLDYLSFNEGAFYLITTRSANRLQFDLQSSERL